jgi:hypothetical protein
LVFILSELGSFVLKLFDGLEGFAVGIDVGLYAAIVDTILLGLLPIILPVLDKG